MSNYVTMLIVSKPLVAANNRGETSGNIQTLQHVSTPRGTRTLLSGYAIKYAVRRQMQELGAETWRKVVEPSEQNPVGYEYGNNNSISMAEADPKMPRGFADGAFGHMVAAKGKEEHAGVMKGAIEFALAVSTSLYSSERSFSRGLKAAVESNGKPALVPFQAERHYTRYQYMITINIPDAKAKGINFPLFFETLKALKVGGSHSSNASELIPDVLAYRFHRTSGSGLYLGAGIDIRPDAPVDTEFLKKHCQDLGISDCVIAGAGTGITVASALKYICNLVK